ncbi:(2Fe-2S) ferredoxin domain-containing protein [Spirochaeta cellobiosiphila]|uniref:(2Fe-2S) ferredoxin domain-containing protein n=1 Tax=Spirochaeta cellobiosiphila TaxID=504483 RepID=UPI000404BC4A|nr:(2Fe-2S) ferredoxin domain-containing protein [Spirochaeta cellobiosiphila]
MAKMSLADLKALRDQKRSEMARRTSEGKIVDIIIGMGTCGIAAGAKDVLNTFVEEINSKQLEGIVIKQTGCMGLCHSEPTVEVHMAGMPDTIYGNVNSEVARKIIGDHIQGKKLVSGHVFDKPATDIK